MAKVERYYADQTQCEGLLALGISRQRKARPGVLPTHDHPGYEICLIEEGSVNWKVGDEVYEIDPGNLFITGPGEIHASLTGSMQPCTLRWCIIHEDAQLMNDYREDLEQWRNSRRVRPGNEQVKAAFDALLAECQNPRPDSRRVQSARVSVLLSECLRTQRPPREGAALSRLRNRITSEPAWWPSIEECARIVGRSRSGLNELCREHWREAPLQFLQRQRISAAKKLLLKADSVTRVAHELGYSSSQHLASAFKKITGMTPSEYVRYAQGDRA